MPGKVENKDLFGADLVKKTQEDVVGLIKVLDDLENKIVGVAKAQQQILNKEDNKTIQSITKTRDAVKNLNEAEKIALKVRKDKLRLEERLKISRTKANLDNQQTKIVLQEEAKINKQLAREKLGLIGAYERESKKLTELRKKYKDLAVSEKIVSKEQRELLIQITLLDQKLKSVDRTVGQSQRNVGNYGKAFGKLGGILRSGLGFLGVASGFALIGRAITSAIKTIRDFDEAVSDIQKVTGLAKQDARELAQELLKIDTRTSVTALLELATAGGRLGLSGRELLDFTEQTDKAFVALGDSLEGTAEDIGLSLGKIASVFGVEQEFGIGEAINKIGSSLNELGARSKAQEGNIQNFTNRLAGVGSAANLSVPEVQALGALFDESGQSMEVAASTFNTLLPAIGKDTKKFAKIAGLDIKEFEKLVTDKPLEALKQVAKGAKSSEKGILGLTKTLKAYGINNARAAGIVTILSDKTERLTELQGIANEAFEEGTSLSDEFAVKNETLNANIEKLGNNFDKLVLSLEGGEGVLSGFFNSIVGGVNDSLVSITRLDKALKGLIDRAIGGREEFITTFAEFTTKGADPATKFLNDIQDNIEKRTDKIAKDFVKKDLATQKTIANNLKRRITADNKLLSEASGFEALNIERRIKAHLLLLSKLKLVSKAREEDVEASVSAEKKLIGLINNQAKVVEDLGKKLREATTEELIFKIGIEIEVETAELERLKRIASSTFEEIDKIERDLIKDSTEKRIANEIEKSEKIIATIESNSRISVKRREELIKMENDRLALFVNSEEVKAGQKRIKLAEDLSKAEFAQRRSGFKTEKAFEKEKAEQFRAIRLKAIKDEIELLEKFGGEGSKIRIENLKAEREALFKFADGFKDMEDLIGAALEVIAEMVDEAFEKRIEKIGEAIDKTGERIDFLRDKAAQGQLASEESLAFEQKKEAQLEKQRKREQKQQQRAQALFTVLSTFQSNVNAGVSNPLQKTFADVAVLKGLANTLGSAFDGMDDTGGRGNVDSKGGKLMVIHPHEQIYSKKDRRDLGFRNRDEVKNIVKSYDNGTLADMMKFDKGNDILSPSAFMLNGLMDTKLLSNKLDQVVKSINSIDIPEGMVHIDEVRKLMLLQSRKGNKITKEYSKLHK